MKAFLYIIALVVFLISIYTDANAQDSLFADPINYSTGYNTRPNNIFASDFDADGDYDLAVTLQNTKSNNVSVFFNNGEGIFQGPVKYTAGYGARSIFAADLDSDHDNDLAIANYYDNNISVLINNGDGTFQDTAKFNTTNSPHNIFAADLDDDSDNDLIVVGGNIVVHINNGNGTFQNGVGYAAGYLPSSVFAIDLDGDNDNDLAVANGGSNTVSLLINKGDGTFQAGAIYSAGNSPNSIFSADLNGDNDNDLAVINRGASADVLVYINNGNATFQDTVVSYGAGYLPNTVIAADLDMDSDNDLIAVNEGFPNVPVLINNGDGTFQAAIFYSAGTRASSVYAADLDGDSDIDLAVANNHSDNISILMNTTLNKTITPIIVTNTNDTGRGSLRKAIDQANTSTGPDSIVFNISTSDSGFDARPGVWTIKPLSPLPLITDNSLHINGSSQTQFAGDLNPLGPEIQLDGSEAVGSPSHGLFILSGMNTVEGLIINRFNDSGILLSGPSANDNLLIDNFIGVNSTADDVLPNGQYGIYIVEGARNSIGPFQPPVPLSKEQKRTKSTRGNILQASSGGGNVIAGNVGGGIYINGEVANENKILANDIVSNYNHGITLKGSVSNTQIFLNTIAFNTGAGVMIDGENAIQNTILTNAITANALDGIVLSGGNLMLWAPIIQAVTDTSIMGLASANSLIQLFGDSDDEGELVLGETSTDGAGQFYWTGAIIGTNVTATATDQNGNTSPFSEPFPVSDDLIVTTTADDDAGSFRKALEQANTQPGPNRILFQIPIEDAGYDANTGVWTIRPTTSLPAIADEDLVIDGYSQAAYIGVDTNIEGPEIELDGSLLTGANGLYIFKSGAIIAGLTINRFDGKGIHVFGVNSGIISGCYIGTDAKGKQSLGNIVGIFLNHNVRNVVIGYADSTLGGNLISGNKNSGITLQDSCIHNNIIGNVIGPNSENMSMQESNLYGIYVTDNCDSNRALFNLIGSNQNSGVFIYKNSNFNFIGGNQIGTDVDFQLDVGNAEDGVKIFNSKNNQILENVIGLNGKSGVRIFGQGAIGNSVQKNAISQNGEKGIELSDGGNAELSPPTISSVTSTQVSGTAQADQVIELFADENYQGQIYLGSVTANAAGDFLFDNKAPLPLSHITSTATDTFGNTSEFSTPVATNVETVTSEQLPEKFVLDQNYPNPFNPSTSIKYALPKSEHVIIAVYNTLGEKIETLVNKPIPIGHHQVEFNGQHLPSSVYFYRIEAGEYIQIRKMLLVK